MNVKGRAVTAILRRRRFILIVVVLVLIYVLSSQVAALRQSLQILERASAPLVVTALFLNLFSYTFSAELYYLLAKRSVSLRSMLLVQVATALTSRIAPIGVGAAGLNLLFLQRKRHSVPQSIAVIATATALSAVGHIVLLIVAATTAPLPSNFGFHISASTALAIGLGSLAVLAGLALFRRLRHKVISTVRNTLHDIGSYRKQPKVIFAALGVNIALSTAYALTLMACSQALGLNLPFNQIFLVYTFSLLTGAATPIPGGLVGVEAGLAGGFVAYGAPASTALAVALLYRLITYWIPLIPGFFAFRTVQRRYF